MDKIRVFVIDNSRVARSMLINILTDLNNVEVIGEAGSGQGSIILLEEIKPDIVFLEAAVISCLPLIAVIKEIKTVNPKGKIILCVEKSISIETILMAKEYGASDIICKPYIKNNVFRVLQEVTNRIKLTSKVAN